MSKTHAREGLFLLKTCIIGIYCHETAHFSARKAYFCPQKNTYAMQDLFTWFSALEGADRLYWYVAIFASTIFLVQTILTFIGIDHFDSGADMDFDAADVSDAVDGHSLGSVGISQLFSVRTIIYFMLGFGWGGVCFGGIEPLWLRGLVAVLTGIVFVALFVCIMRIMFSLETSGNVSIQECMGATADVYLRIGAERSSKGKVSLSLGGALREYDALTDGPEIPSGAKVKVTGVESSTLIVNPIK